MDYGNEDGDSEYVDVGQAPSEEDVNMSTRGSRENEHDDGFAPATKKQRKSAAGRRLVRWSPDMDQLVLLTVDFVCAREGIPVPWDLVAVEIEPWMTGEAIKQHLAKVISFRKKEGWRVPPPMGKNMRRAPKTVPAPKAATPVKTSRAKAVRATPTPITKGASLLHIPPAKAARAAAAAAASPTVPKTPTGRGRKAAVKKESQVPIKIESTPEGDSIAVRSAPPAPMVKGRGTTAPKRGRQAKSRRTVDTDTESENEAPYESPTKKQKKNTQGSGGRSIELRKGFGVDYTTQLADDQDDNDDDDEFAVENKGKKGQHRRDLSSLKGAQEAVMTIDKMIAQASPQRYGNGYAAMVPPMSGMPNYYQTPAPTPYQPINGTNTPRAFNSGTSTPFESGLVFGNAGEYFVPGFRPDNQMVGQGRGHVGGHRSVPVDGYASGQLSGTFMPDNSAMVTLNQVYQQDGHQIGMVAPVSQFDAFDSNHFDNGNTLYDHGLHMDNNAVRKHDNDTSVSANNADGTVFDEPSNYGNTNPFGPFVDTQATGVHSNLTPPLQQVGFVDSNLHGLKHSDTIDSGYGSTQMSDSLSANYDLLNDIDIPDAQQIDDLFA